MTTRILGKNTRLHIERYLTYLNSFDATFGVDIDTVDIMVYLQDWKETLPVKAGGSFDIQGYLTKAATPGEGDGHLLDASLLGETMGKVLDSTPHPISMIPDAVTPVAGQRVFYADFDESNISLRLPAGAAGEFSMNSLLYSEPRSGLLIAYGDFTCDVTPNTDTFTPVGGVDVGVGFTAGIASIYHFWNKSGSGNVTIALQEAADTGGPYSDKIVFQSASPNLGGDYVELASPTDNEFHRVRFRSSEASEVISFMVASRRY